MKIYIVEGDTGSYEDNRTWVVAIYTSRIVADYHQKLAQAEANRIKYKYSSANGVKNKYDEKFDMDYSGTFYKVIEEEVSDIKNVDEFEKEMFIKVL